MLTLCHIAKSFNNHSVLKDINLNLEPGIVTELMGDSGSGKSTIAKIITGLIRPDKGFVLYEKDHQSRYLWDVKDNIDTHKVKALKKYPRSLGCDIQMVYQAPIASLDPALKIGPQIKELMRYYKKHIDIKPLLESLELKEELLVHYPSQISGGEAQRINVLRALIMEPQILILDEATSMLDTINQAFILNYCVNQFLTPEKAILMISHEEALVKQYASKIMILEDGVCYEKEHH